MDLKSYLQTGASRPVDPVTQPVSKGLRLLSVGTNPKTIKGEKLGYLTFILHLAPAQSSGAEVCHWRSAGCTSGCLNTAGHASMFESIHIARRRKTQWFHDDRSSFMGALAEDVRRAIGKAHRKGMIPVFRLNGTSDILWERIPVGGADSIMDLFPLVTFYDYTKAPAKLRANRPDNYHLTFSLNEENERQARRALDEGMSVAVVFRDKHFPETFWGYPVVNGDEHDLRFLDPAPAIVGLKAKGKARKDTSGFVKDVELKVVCDRAEHVKL